MLIVYLLTALLIGIAIGFVPLWLFVIKESAKIENGLKAAGYNIEDGKWTAPETKLGLGCKQSKI